MHDYSQNGSHILVGKGKVIAMSDSPQNLEQLIRQYTQELLRLQQSQPASPVVPANSQPTPPPVIPKDDPTDMEEVVEDILEGDLPDREDNEDRDDRNDLEDLLEDIFDRDDRPDRPERPERPERPDRPERPEPPRPERPDMPPNPPRPPQPPTPPPVDPTPDVDSFGKLVVRVFKANGALPVPDAKVTISREEKGTAPTLVTTTTTDRSGFTPAITLPTVSAALSLEPGYDQPYATYLVQVQVPGYFTVDDLMVPVYSGITSVQPAEMVPLPENYQGSTSIVLPEREPDL